MNLVRMLQNEVTILRSHKASSDTMLQLLQAENISLRSNISELPEELQEFSQVLRQLLIALGADRQERTFRTERIPQLA